MTVSRRQFIMAAPPAFLAGGCNGPGLGNVLPDTVLPALPGLTDAGGWPVPGFASDEFRRGVALLTVWASWCPYCFAEHGHLLRLAADRRVRLLGLVVRDDPRKAVAFLRREGNPFRAVAADDGRLSGLLRAPGVPASYVIGADARLEAKILAAIDDSVLRARVRPALDRALARQATGATG